MTTNTSPSLDLQRLLTSLSAVGLVLTCFVAGSAQAEKADSQKVAEISAEYSLLDGKSNTRTLTGDVELSRGTLMVKADKAIVREATDGHQSTSLFGTPGGGKVTFRQKRDGGDDLWIEGEAEKVDYDEKSEVVKFISRAKVRFLEGKKVTQEQEGEFLSYDNFNDLFVAANDSSGKHVLGGGRVRLTLQPKTQKEAQ